MKQIPRSIFFLGLFFVVLGITWVYIIYTRANVVLPPEQKAIVKQQFITESYRELKKEMNVAITRPSVIDQYIAPVTPTPPPTLTTPAQPPAVPVEKPKSYLTMFWLLSCVEVVCSILYVFAGISVLRLYPWGRLIVFLTLYMDLLLKGMVIVYMDHWAVPLATKLEGINILTSYFLHGPVWKNYLSAYLTGIKFCQPQGALFLFIYLVYLFACFYIFTQPAIKKQFARS